MSRNEDLSQFDPTAEIPETKFDPILQDVYVVNNKLLTKMNNDQITDLGDFKLASAIYVVGGYINPIGRAVIQLSDGNEVVLNKVTNDRAYQVTLDGQGYFTGNDKSELQFIPVETNFPMTFDGKTFAFARTNGLRLDRYLRLDHLSPATAGRTYTSWTPVRIDRALNNLGVAINGNLFTLPAGNYYVKITGQHFRGVIGYMSLIDTATNLPVMREAVSVSHTDGSGTQLLLNQKITLSQDTQLYFGAKTSVAQTNSYGLGLGLSLDINNVFDIFNTVEIWRLND